jgi:hypothetical protein
MLSFTMSTIAFFVTGYFIKRRFDEVEFPRGMTRSALIFSLALAVSYGVAAVVSAIAGN